MSAVELTTYRVWFERKAAPPYDLVQAASADDVYRSYRKQKRNTITRVERVVKSSEGRALKALGDFLVAMGGSRRTKTRRRA